MLKMISTWSLPQKGHSFGVSSLGSKLMIFISAPNPLSFHGTLNRLAFSCGHINTHDIFLVTDCPPWFIRYVLRAFCVLASFALRDKHGFVCLLTSSEIITFHFFHLSSKGRSSRTLSKSCLEYSRCLIAPWAVGFSAFCRFSHVLMLAFQSFILVLPTIQPLDS